MLVTIKFNCMLSNGWVSLKLKEAALEFPGSVPLRIQSGVVT